MNNIQRSLCLQSLLRVLEEDEYPRKRDLLAQEIEHVIRSVSKCCGLTYTFEVQKMLVYIRSKKFLEFMQKSPDGNIISFLQAPREDLFKMLPCYDEVEEEEKKREKGLAVLSVLCSEELSHVPNTGIACGKCRSKDIIYSMGQTRSADEGTTVWATCQACSKRWKM